MLDLNDPDVATKIMWNNAFRPIFTDDYDLRFFDCESVYGEAGKKQTFQTANFQVGHYAGYNLVGRTEVEPMPFDPDFKTTHRYWLFGLYPILAPAEIKGTGFVRWRYSDPLKGDDVWAFLPAARRLRRLNETSRGPDPGVCQSSADTWIARSASAAAPGERIERSFAHLYDTGGMCCTHPRCHPNILSRLLIHAGGFNLGLVMRHRFGFGTPRGLQDRTAILCVAVQRS